MSCSSPELSARYTAACQSAKKTFLVWNEVTCRVLASPPEFFSRRQKTPDSCSAAILPHHLLRLALCRDSESSRFGETTLASAANTNLNALLESRGGTGTESCPCSPPQWTGHSNLFSLFQGVFGTPNAVILDAVAQALSFGAQQLVAKYSPQVRMLDLYTLFAVSLTERLSSNRRMCALRAQPFAARKGLRFENREDSQLLHLPIRTRLRPFWTKNGVRKCR